MNIVDKIKTLPESQRREAFAKLKDIVARKIEAKKIDKLKTELSELKDRRDLSPESRIKKESKKLNLTEDPQLKESLNELVTQLNGFIDIANEDKKELKKTVQLFESNKIKQDDKVQKVIDSLAKIKESIKEVSKKDLSAEVKKQLKTFESKISFAETSNLSTQKTFLKQINTLNRTVLNLIGALDEYVKKKDLTQIDLEAGRNVSITKVKEGNKVTYRINAKDGSQRVVGLVKSSSTESGSSLPDQTGQNGKFLSTDGSNPQWTSIPGGGDMLASTYDPQNIAGDAFSRTNHTGEQGISTITDLQTELDAKALDNAVVKLTGIQTIGGTKTFTSSVLVPDQAYDSTNWNGSLSAPTKNAVRDKISTMDQAIALNTAKQTNATHTGDVLGSTILSLGITAITGKTGVTPLGEDYILISDTSDSGNLKKALISDLPSSGGGSGDVTAGASFGTDNVLIRSDGVGKGVQSSTVTLSDLGVMKGMILGDSSAETTLKFTDRTLEYNFGNTSSISAGLRYNYAGLFSPIIINHLNTESNDPAILLNFYQRTGPGIELYKGSTLNSEGHVKFTGFRPEFELVDHFVANGYSDGGPAGKFEFRSAFDTFQINGRGASDSGFEEIVVVKRKAEGGGLYALGREGLNVNTGNASDSVLRLSYNSTAEANMDDYIELRAKYIGNNNGDFEMWHKISTGASTLILSYDTSAQRLAVTGDITVSDEVYGSSWNGSLEVPTKNAIYDKIETISGGGISEELAIAYAIVL